MRATRRTVGGWTGHCSPTTADRATDGTWGIGAGRAGWADGRVIRVKIAADTSLDAAEVQARVFRRMAPADRVALACEMSEEVRILAADGLRRRSRQPVQSPSDEAAPTLLRG